jgi:hypothetical protein
MLSFWRISLIIAFFLSISRSSVDRFDQLAHSQG